MIKADLVDLSTKHLLNAIWMSVDRAIEEERTRVKLNERNKPTLLKWRS
jgi:hypothetical protein